MKVLNVITSLLSGGAEKLMVDLLPRYADEGITAEIAVFNAVETDFMECLAEKGITIHRFFPEGKNVYHPANYLKLKRLISSGKYDIVHTHNTAAQIFAAMCARVPHTRFITTEHNTENRRRSLPLLRHFDRWMYGRYHSVVSISQSTKDNLLQFIGCPDSPKFPVISNGIDLEKFAAEPKSLDTDGEINILMVAGFRPQKDHDTLLRALSMLPSRFTVTLAGDGERRKDIEQLIGALGIGSRVKMLGMRSDVPDLIKASDIVVVSSHWEGFGLAAVEGMAAGRPVIASDVPGLSEVVSGYGVLFTPGDADALKREILRLASDRDLYERTSLACQQRAADFAIEATALAYMDLYNKVNV